MNTIKKFSLAMAALMVSALPMSANQWDVNGDGHITSADVTAIYDHLLNNDMTYAESAYDVDGDGHITSADITAVYDVILNGMPSNITQYTVNGVTFAMVAFASLLTCITATMISLEGKAFNILKTLPISGKKVLMTKVLSAMLLIVPVTLLGWLVMCLRFQFGILDAILVLIGVVAMPLVTELIGILINLKYPRFDADNDTVVVRQSASVMVATFLGLGMVFATISMTFTTIFLAGQTAGLAIMDAVYVIVAFYLYFTIVMRGDEKYLKLVT